MPTTTVAKRVKSLKPTYPKTRPKVLLNLVLSIALEET
jgi:hypothetical protein